MPGVPADDEANADNDMAAQPYAPSWVDHLTAWVAGLPWPTWSFYLGLMIPLGWLFVVNPWIDLTTDRVALFAVLIVQFFAVATFIWPQLGIHRLQVAEKERLLEEANQRFEATIADLHQRIDDGKLEGIFDLSSAMGGLATEKKALEDIPTWPREPEVVRLLITALALLLGLWVLQFVLQRWLGS